MGHLWDGVKQQIRAPFPTGSGAVGDVTVQRIVEGIRGDDNDPEDTHQSHIEPGDTRQEERVPKGDDRPYPDRVAQAAEGVGNFDPEREYFGLDANFQCSRFWPEP